MPPSNQDQPLIQNLIRQHGGGENADLVEDIIETSLRLLDDKADRLATYLGLRLTPDPDATPPEPTPENLARPMLAKTKAKQKAN